jgi:hypothetical protein
MDFRSEARQESRRYYSDSVGQRGGLLPYRGQQKVRRSRFAELFRTVRYLRIPAGVDANRS